jgi:hypothetical protein
MLNVSFYENGPCFPHPEYYLPLSLPLPVHHVINYISGKIVGSKNPPLFFCLFWTQNEDWGL